MSLITIYVDGVKWGLISARSYCSIEFKRGVWRYNRGQWKKLFLALIGRVLSKGGISK